METFKKRIRQIEEDSTFQGTDIELSSILKYGGAFTYKGVIYATLPLSLEEYTEILMVTCASTTVVDDLDHALTDESFLRFVDMTEAEAVEVYKNSPELFLYDYIQFFNLELQAISIGKFLHDYITE